MEPNEHDKDRGLKKKVATGVAVGLATTAAAGVAKKLLSNDEGEQGAGQEQARGARGSQPGSAGSATRARKPSSPTSRSGSSRRRTSSSARGTKSQTKARSSSAGSSGARRRAERTKEQLYREAKRLKIEGRSTMNKAQLQRAVQRARA